MKRFAYLAAAPCLFCPAAWLLVFHRPPSEKLSRGHGTGTHPEGPALGPSTSKAGPVPNRAAVLNNYSKIPLSFEAMLSTMALAPTAQRQENSLRACHESTATSSEPATSIDDTIGWGGDSASRGGKIFACDRSGNW